tara:strand:+ start:531 stop:1262 length:732 start_codon:yes stop_codon:yes gene_type:complete
VTEFKPGKLLDFFKYFNSQNKNHIEAIRQLQEEVEALDPALMADGASWVSLYRGTNTQSLRGYFTPYLLQQLTGYDHYLFDEIFISDLNELMHWTGFDQHLTAMQMLMANLMHESANFKFMTEIDPGHYLEGRTDIGNKFKGDGPKFRGCGPLQVTGRAAFEAFEDWLFKTKGIKDRSITDLGTEYVANKYPFLIAISWIERNDLLNICLNRGFDACCVRINGGWNGYPDRLAKFQTCKQYMV